MRMGDWKLVFGEQRVPGGFVVWANPFTKLRVPKLFNLRMDPYERADVVSDQYYDWSTKNIFIAQQGVFRAAKFLETFVAYPPSQKAPSFSVDQIMEDVRAKIEQAKAMQQGVGGRALR
jgi:arylsulfatase